MSVEATLTREFNITFIDAREIVTMARLNLGIEGYLTNGHKPMVLNEARKIYHNLPAHSKLGMADEKESLDAFKLSTSSHHRVVSDDNNSDGTKSGSKPRSSSSLRSGGSGGGGGNRQPQQAATSIWRSFREDCNYERDIKSTRATMDSSDDISLDADSLFSGPPKESRRTATRTTATKLNCSHSSLRGFFGFFTASRRESSFFVPSDGNEH